MYNVQFAEVYGNATISQAKNTWEDFAESNGHYISLCSACQLSIRQEILVHGDLAKWQMEGFDVLERGDVLTPQQEIHLKRKNHLLNEVIL